MYRKIILAVALLGLGACAGPNTNELLTEKPTQIINTTASVEEAKNCIVALDPAHYIPTPRQDGWLIMSTIQGFNEEAAFAVMIHPTEYGSRVEAHLGHAPIFGDWPDYLKPCLDKLPRS